MAEEKFTPAGPATVIAAFQLGTGEVRGVTGGRKMVPADAFEGAAVTTTTSPRRHRPRMAANLALILHLLSPALRAGLAEGSA